MDVPVGAVPAPAPATPAARAPDPSVARAAKLAAVSAGLAKLDPAKLDAPAPVLSADVAAAAAPAADKKPAEPAPETKIDPAPIKPDEPPVDDKTAKGLAAIDRRAKAFRDEQVAAKASLDLERAELARLRSEVTGRASSFEELQKLAKVDPIAVLAKLGIDSEDDWETIGRGAYPRTKAGKADPRAAPAVAQTAREATLAAKLEAVERRTIELDEQIRSRDSAAQTQVFVDRYLDDAVKAIPAAPTLIGKLHAKSPAKARETLLELGKAMERHAMEQDGATKYDPSYTPSNAELIATYEKLRRAELEEQGVDVDALLAPVGAAPAPKAVTKPAVTLDPTSTTGTRPINGNPTREQKLAAVSAGLKKLDAEI